jgi:hypothetical protein
MGHKNFTLTMIASKESSSVQLAVFSNITVIEFCLVSSYRKLSNKQSADLFLFVKFAI